MTREGFATRWRARRVELARLGAHVDGAKLCDEVLADFESLITTEDDELITLQGAAERSGYHKDHLRRLVRGGKLPAARRGRRLLFRVVDLPKKLTVVDAQPTAMGSPCWHARPYSGLFISEGICLDALPAAPELHARYPPPYRN